MSVFPSVEIPSGWKAAKGDGAPGFNVHYFSGIAPTIGKNEYGELIKQFETQGKLPTRLKIKGLALDDSTNANGWKVDPNSLDTLASQLDAGLEIRKDHSNSVDDIIGKTTKGWREGNQVLYEGEIADRAIIEKVLLGYIKFDSIQVIAPQVYCLNCMENEGREREDAKIESMEEACPRCGSFALYIENPIAIEMSLVTMPAYPNAETFPIGFRASVDQIMQERIRKSKSKKKEDTPAEQYIPSVQSDIYDSAQNPPERPEEEDEEAMKVALLQTQATYVATNMKVLDVLVKDLMRRAHTVVDI